MRNARSMIAAALAPLFAAGAWLRRVASPTRYRATFRGAFLVVEVERAGRVESTAHALRDIHPSSLRIVRRQRRLFAASESSLVVRAAGVDVVLLRGRGEPMERAARDVRAWFVRMREAQRSADAAPPEACEQDALACTSPMATCHTPKPMRVLSGDDVAPATSTKIGWSEQTWPESGPRHGERLPVTLPPGVSPRLCVSVASLSPPARARAAADPERFKETRVFVPNKALLASLGSAWGAPAGGE